MKLTKIETGNFMLDGGALFGVIPKSLWQKVYPADERNLCNLAMRCLLVETAGRVVLIDTGIGTKQTEKFFSHYYLNGDYSLEKSLAAHGCRPEDITDVLLTHLHFDHVGGALTRDADSGKSLPAFPSASYWVSREQWEWAARPNRRERASFLPGNIEPLEGSIHFLEAEGEFLPGLELRFFHGHTGGLVVPLISYGGETLVYVGDLFPTAAHIPAAWVCGYDTRPLLSFTEREVFLEEAFAGDYVFYFEHDLAVECCRLEETAKGFRAGEAFSLEKFINL